MGVSEDPEMSVVTVLGAFGPRPGWSCLKNGHEGGKVLETTGVDSSWEMNGAEKEGSS